MSTDVYVECTWHAADDRASLSHRLVPPVPPPMPPDSTYPPIVAGPPGRGFVDETSVQNASSGEKCLSLSNY